MIKQHTSSIVSPKAIIADNVEIAPYSLIEDNVEIGEGTYIGPHVCVYSGARIGKNTRIFQSASISHAPQDLKYEGEPTEVFIGDNVTIHEFVTVHRGTSALLSNQGTGKTTIGNDVLLMAYSHIAHDCYIGNNCILANAVQLGGHVYIDDWSILGGGVLVHQFCVVGKHIMVGGGYRIVKDIPPFLLAAGEPLRYEGLNVVGLRRHGFTSQQVTAIKKIYAILFSKSYNVSQAKTIISEQFAENEYAKDILEFINSSKRGILGKS